MSQVLKFTCIIFIQFAYLAYSKNSTSRGTLVNAERLIDWELSTRGINLSKAQMRVSTEEFPTLNLVHAYKIRFKTVDHKDRSIESTGLALIPTLTDAPLKFLSYQHATRMSKREAPTALPVDPEAQANTIFHASQGRVVTMADYLGLDKINESAQFYLNAEIQARVAYDLIQATKEFLKKNNQKYSNTLYIAGYSQGAHNALGLHRYIQNNHKDTKILATAALSGAYSVSKLTRQVLDKEVKVKINPIFVGLAIYGMHEAYDDFPRFSEILQKPYSENLPELLKKGNFSAVRKEIPEDIDEFFDLPKVLEIIDETDEHPFWSSLIKNDVDNFVPNAPVLMIHSKRDTVIPFSTAKESYEKLRNLGADIKMIEFDSELSAGHVDAAYPAFIEAAKFFNAVN